MRFILALVPCVGAYYLLQFSQVPLWKFFIGLVLLEVGRCIAWPGYRR